MPVFTRTKEHSMGILIPQAKKKEFGGLLLEYKNDAEGMQKRWEWCSLNR